LSGRLSGASGAGAGLHGLQEAGKKKPAGAGHRKTGE